ncbi:hypothetical protein ES705_28044 [subsurface metagenome]
MDIKDYIINKFKGDFEICNTICNLTENVIDQKWEVKIKSTEGKLLHYDYVISLLFSKTFKTYKSINILCKEGYGQDAGILLRSLFEIYVNITYISKDEPEKMAKRYYEYSYIGKKHLVELSDRHNLEKIGFKNLGEGIQRNKGELYRLYNPEQEKDFRTFVTFKEVFDEDYA